MTIIRQTLDLQELVISVYAALDDALIEAGVTTNKGKPIICTPQELIEE